MPIGFRRRSLRASVLLSIIACPLVALAQGVAVGVPGAAVTADAVPVFAPAWRPGNDAPAPRPNHPPIDEIPDKPMLRVGENEILLPAFSGTVVEHNALTGETREMVLPEPDGPVGHSEPTTTFNGQIMRGYEMQRMNSTLSPVGAATLPGYPIRVNVRLVMRFLNNNGTSQHFRCSGSMQDAGVVLTAAHCIWDSAPQYSNNPAAREVWVYPSWDGVGNSVPTTDPNGNIDVINTFGWARGYHYIYGQAYADTGSFDRDVAAIRLYRTDTRNVGMLTDAYGWARGVCTTSLDVYNYSYPAETVPMGPAPTPVRCTVGGLHTGRQMYFWNGRPNYCPGTTTPNGLTNQFRFEVAGTVAENQLCLQPVWGGMSGGALYYINNATRYAVAVCSHGPATYRAISYCALWAEFTTALEQFKTDNRGTAFDAEAFKFRITTSTFQAGSAVNTGSMVVTNPTNNNPANRTYTVRFYLSDNNNISDGDTLLATHTFTHDFPAYGYLNLTVAPFTVPANTPAGNYWIGAILDNATDTNTDNNDTDAWDAQAVVVQACPIPAAPGGVSASDGGSCNYVSLSWGAAGGATQYYIYRNTVNSSATAAYLTATAGLTYQDATAVAGTTYYYFVRAGNGCGTGAFSTGNAGFRGGPPAPPSSVGASDGTVCTGVRVTWNASVNATNYRIYRSTTNNSASAALRGTSTSSPYTDTTAVLGTTYYYWVIASNGCGLSAFSNGNAGSVGNPPGAPTGVAASDAATCTPAITVTWNELSDATGYQVWRHSSNNSGSASLLTTIVAPPYEDFTAAAGPTYYYWIKTLAPCIPGGVSGFSASNAGTRGTAASAPTGVNATDGTRCRSVTVFWNPPAGATSYHVFRGTTNNSGTATLLGGIAAPPYIDNTVVGTTVYYYFVKAANSCGLSGFSTGNSGFGGNAFVIDTHPRDTAAAAGGPVTFFANAGGAAGFQWRKDGQPLANDGHISGVTGRTLTIDPVSPGDAGSYTCAMTSPCGNATSNGAELTVEGIACPADFNQDGGIDGSDVDAFFTAWSSGDFSADVNQDGGVDGSDVQYFFSVWEAGGCP